MKNGLLTRTSTITTKDQTQEVRKIHMLHNYEGNILGITGTFFLKSD